MERSETVTLKARSSSSVTVPVFAAVAGVASTGPDSLEHGLFLDL